MPELEEWMKKQTEVVTALADGLANVEKATHKRLDQIETILKRTPRGADLPHQPDDKSDLQKAQELMLRKGDDRELKSLSVGVEADGGFVVEPTMENAIYSRVQEYSPFRSVAAVSTITTDAWEQVRNSDTTPVEWVGEKQARAETGNPTLETIRIPVHEQHAQSLSTTKLLDDARINVEQWLSDKFGEAFGIQEGAAFISGDGISKPRGVLDYGQDAVTTDDATRDWRTLQYVPTGDASDFDTGNDPADALIDLVHKLKPVFRARGTWIMNRATLGEIRKFKDGQGNYLVNQGNVAGGQPTTLLGYRIVEMEDMPDVGADTFPVAFGDFSRGYHIIQRQGVRILRDPYSNKPYVLFDATRRVGGDVFDFDAIKLLKCAST